MKTTKILALTLALLMSVTLAACSNGNNNTSGGSTNTPPPSETPSAPSSNGAQGSGGNDPGNSGIFNDGTDVPDNGTPPYVEPPLESHRGDKGYFYAETDDYIVFTEEHTDYVMNIDVTIYSLVTFRYIEEADVAGRRMYKTVFPGNDAANEAANAYAENNVSGFTVVDNVVYGMPFAWPEPPPMERKADIISRLDDAGRVYYLSTPSGNGGDPGTTYGTIPMPDGFPENPGDAEFFNPVTDDYLILHNPEAASLVGEKIYYLVSYDRSGEPVQWVTKVIWPSADVVPTGWDQEGWGPRVAVEGVVVENAGFHDSMAMFVERGYDIPQALRSNYLPPTKDSADFTSTEYTRQGVTSEYRRNEGGYIIITNTGYIIGPAAEHFYFSKP